MLSSLENAKASFGDDSSQYCHLKQMVDGAIQELRSRGAEAEVSEMLQKLSLIRTFGNASDSQTAGLGEMMHSTAPDKIVMP